MFMWEPTSLASGAESDRKKNRVFALSRNQILQCCKVKIFFSEKLFHGVVYLAGRNVKKVGISYWLHYYSGV